MPQRRRFTAGEELAEILARREPDVDWPAALRALEAEGVDVGALVKTVVDEEV